MKRLTLCLLIVFGLLLAAPAMAIKYSLLESEDITPEILKQMMSDGPMLMIKEDADGALDLISSGIIIDAPPEQVYAAVTDYNNFPEFMPSTEGCKLLKKEGDEELVSFHIKFTFSVLSYTVKYNLLHHMIPGKGVWWEMESGDLNKAVGSWEMIPLDGGNKTAAIYSNYSDIRSIGRVVRYFIEKEPSMDVAINASTCILVLKAVRDRVEEGVYKNVKAFRPGQEEDKENEEPDEDEADKEADKDKADEEAEDATENP